MNNPYRILHLEDVQTDAELVAREFKKNNIEFEHCVIDTLSEYIEALDHFRPDVILCDHSLPAFNSIKALEVLHAKKLEIPFILITATMSEDVAMSVVNKGADDYILKDRLKRLPYAVINAIEKATYEKDRKQMIASAFEKEMVAKKELKKLSEKLLMATEVAGLGIWEYEVEKDKLTVDDTILALNGVTRKNFDGSYTFFQKLIDPKDLVNFQKQVEKGANLESYTVEFRIILPNGNIRWLRSSIKNQRNNQGGVVRIIGTSQDVTEQKVKELLIKESEEKYRSFFENSMDGILLSIPNGTVIAANASAQAIFNLTEPELCTRTRHEIFDYRDERLFPFLDERQIKGRAKGEFRLKRKDGSTFEAEVSSAIFNDELGNKRSSLIIRDISERIRSQQLIIQSSEALKIALDDFKKIMSSSLDIICTIDVSGRFVMVSDACLKIWQYTPAELSSQPLIQFVHPEDINSTKTTVGFAMEGNPVNLFRNRITRKDGKTVPMFWSAKWDEGSKLMYCIASDATQKVKLEKAFEYERQRFKDMFHQAPSSIASLKGKEHRFELANDKFLQFTGKTNILGKTVRDVLPELEAQGFIKILDSVFNLGHAYSAVEMHIKLDIFGNGIYSDLYFNFICQPYRDKSGEVEGIFFFANNVTEQVFSRRKAITENANFQAILNNTNISYLLLDKDARIIAFNRKANENMLETLGKPLQKDENFVLSFRGATRSLLKENIARVFTGLTLEKEFLFPMINGTPRWYRYKMEPISIENNVSGVCIAAEDITIKKDAEIEKEKITRDLIQRNNDLEQFNYIVSHNLRAPVANIAGAMAIIRDSELPANEMQMFCNAASSSADRLDAIIQDLNTILEIRNKQDKGREFVKFSSLVQNITDSIGKTEQDTCFTINTQFEEADGINSVKSYLYSIFYNLISNSIKYRQPNNPLLISISSRTVDDHVQLIFADNGIGFDAAGKKEQVFKLYKRFHNHIDGKGIGLFIVKTQVETLGGKIEVTSAVNRGTTFTISI